VHIYIQYVYYSKEHKFLAPLYSELKEKTARRERERERELLKRNARKFHPDSNV